MELTVYAQALVEEIVLLCEKYFREINFSLLENIFPRWKKPIFPERKIEIGYFPLEKNIFPSGQIFFLIEKYFPS
jgi:hypothetical protein